MALDYLVNLYDEMVHYPSNNEVGVILTTFISALSLVTLLVNSSRK